MKRAASIIIVVLAIAGSFWMTRPRDEVTLAGVFGFLVEFFPPELDATFVRDTAGAALETLAMSISGTAIAVIIAFAVAWSATAGRIVRWISKLAFVVLRSIPELLWALVFVFVAGLGPAAGALALALHTTGVLGKLFTDTFENVDRRIVESARAVGGSPAGVSLFAVIPQAWTRCISFTLYRWEINIRTAAIVGLVGAGGLGQAVYTTTNLFQYHRVLTLIVVIFIVVTAVDYASRALQRIYS